MGDPGAAEQSPWHRSMPGGTCPIQVIQQDLSGKVHLSVGDGRRSGQNRHDACRSNWLQAGLPPTRALRGCFFRCPLCPPR
ncbi:MAG: hypothetical protein EKK55_07205 [Rhodocyclaceae bacterium]|nr:MAG: hypothetical protein EKK55_07205 [Rhodocyclaceae bacterium]